MMVDFTQFSSHGVDDGGVRKGGRVISYIESSLSSAYIEPVKKKPFGGTVQTSQQADSEGRQEHLAHLPL